MKGKNSGFILLAVLAAVLVSGITYMFLFKPMLEARQEAIDEKESVESFNEQLTIRLLEYQREWQKMPEYQDHIAQIATQLRPQEDMPAIRELIASTFDKYGLRVEVDSVAAATLMEPGAVSLGVPAASMGRESYVDGLEFANLYQTTVKVEAYGNQMPILLAAGELQLREDRLIVVQGLEVNPEPTEDLPDQYRGSFNVIFFTLVDPDSGLDPGGVVGE